MKSALVLVVVWSGVAAAQPDPTVLHPARTDAATCALLDLAPGALIEPPATGDAGVPIPWTELVLKGTLIDNASTVHALLATGMQRYASSLTAKSWPEIAALTARYGYQLLGHLIVGTKLELTLAPLPMIRKLEVHISHQGLFDKLLDDEIRRRLRLRPGAYLPWDGQRRTCALNEERGRLLDYLHDEGYSDAQIELTPNGNEIEVDVDRGPVYKLDVDGIRIPKPPRQSPSDPESTLALTDAEIRKLFDHGGRLSSDRFTRTQHQADLAELKKRFQQRGYPAVRIESSFDPKTSFDRHSHTVKIALTIDQRRQLFIDFQGPGISDVSEDQMRAQLTFNAAGSADDVEAAASAHALQTWFQNGGRFDARVTWRREEIGPFDRITFFIDQGPVREVRRVEFVGARAIAPAVLADLVATRAANVSGALLGINTAAATERLAADVDRIVEVYRRAGYRDARVQVNASPEPYALGDAALTAALALAGEGHELYVRFTIDEGPPTLLTRVAFKTPTGEPIRDDDPNNLNLCADLLRELSNELAAPALAVRVPGKDCATAVPATAAAPVLFREDVVTGTRDQLRQFLFKTGRPRAVVELGTPEQPAAHQASVIYTVSRTEKLTIGKVVVRGNFKTTKSIVYGQLKFHEGELLTQDALAEAARQLRGTGLFNAVNIELPDLEGGSSVINAIVRVEERYDNTGELEVDGGYSSYQSWFIGGVWRQLNMFGIGAQFIANGTISTKVQDLEGTLLFPQWLVAHVLPFELATSVTGLYKLQDTPGFGLLKTEGATVAFQRTIPRVRTATQSARAITIGVHYDYRLRTRNVDALRPIGADMDQSQVAVPTVTGSIGATVEWQQLTDRRGTLVPLAPEAGFRLYANASIAAPELLGQDTFVKVAASATKLVPVGSNLVLRGDLRYDQGFPLGGAVLLPEVERFFAGGDNTVRGYADDRLATEIIQVGVPPIGGLSQIRVLPAGGDIRVLASLDAQLRIWKILAAAVFSDAGLVTNEWSTVTTDSIRPSVGMGLRALTPFGIGALEYAIPIHPELGDDPRGRIHFYFAARAQF